MKILLLSILTILTFTFTSCGEDEGLSEKEELELKEKKEAEEKAKQKKAEQEEEEKAKQEQQEKLFKASVSEKSLTLFGHISDQQAKKIIEKIVKDNYVIETITVFKAPDLTELNFNTLKDIKTLKIKTNWNLKTISCNALENVSYKLQVSYCPNLIAFKFPNLKNIGSSLSIVKCSKLTSFELPKLKSVGGNVNIGNFKEIISIELPSLERVGALSIGYTKNLTALKFPKLTTVKESSIGLCWKHEGQVIMGNNIDLSSFEFPKLIEFNQIHISDKSTKNSIKELLKHFTEVNPPIKGKYIKFKSTNPCSTEVLGFIDILKTNNNRVDVNDIKM